MINPVALQMVLSVLAGWLDRREREAIAYLIEENRLRRRQLGGRRLRFTDDDRRRLAARAYRVGRATLRELATIATPDTPPRAAIHPWPRCVRSDRSEDAVLGYPSEASSRCPDDASPVRVSSGRLASAMA